MEEWIAPLLPLKTYGHMYYRNLWQEFNDCKIWGSDDGEYEDHSQSGIWHYDVLYVSTNILEKHAASIFKVQEWR
jgi:hypothetical protein